MSNTPENEETSTQLRSLQPLNELSASIMNLKTTRTSMKQLEEGPAKYSSSLLAFLWLVWTPLQTLEQNLTWLYKMRRVNTADFSLWTCNF